MTSVVDPFAPEKQRNVLAIGDIVLSDGDAFIEEQHTLSAQVTREPVEEGADVSDHVIQEPNQVRIVIQVSNTPLGPQNESPVPFRAQEAFGRLVEMKEAGKPVTVITSMGYLDNMVITSISLPRDAKLANVVRCTVDLVNVRIIRSGTVDLPETETERVVPEVDRGNQPAVEVTPQQRESFLLKASEALTALFGGP